MIASLLGGIAAQALEQNDLVLKGDAKYTRCPGESETHVNKPELPFGKGTARFKI